jgi:hypothetical protein
MNMDTDTDRDRVAETDTVTDTDMDIDTGTWSFTWHFMGHKVHQHPNIILPNKDRREFIFYVFFACEMYDTKAFVN